MILKLAWRNIIGRGMRTWLNVAILSIVMVTIVAFQGIYHGWEKDGENGIIKWHIADGQYWHRDYDPYDSFSFAESRRQIPPEIADDDAVEFLVSQGVVYPQGRMKNITLKAVEEDQKLLELPAQKLVYEEGRNKLMLGERTAKKLKVSQDDKLMLRWRNDSGSFDAAEFEIVHIFSTVVTSIDQGQVWLGLTQLREMLGSGEVANYFTVADESVKAEENWEFKSQKTLLKEFQSLIDAKKSGGMFMYFLLLFLAMIAVFDTQVLSLFKRRKEVGMMMAMGMHKPQIIRVFVLEGILSGMLALILAVIWGTPLLMNLQSNGIQLPEYMGGYGVDGLLDKLYPLYTMPLVITTVLMVMLIVLAVSYLPVRSISHLMPVDALAGRMTDKKKDKQYAKDILGG